MGCPKTVGGFYGGFFLDSPETALAIRVKCEMSQ